MAFNEALTTVTVHSESCHQTMLWCITMCGNISSIMVNLYSTFTYLQIYLVNHKNLSKMCNLSHPLSHPAVIKFNRMLMATTLDFGLPFIVCWDLHIFVERRKRDLYSAKHYYTLPFAIIIWFGRPTYILCSSKSLT